MVFAVLFIFLALIPIFLSQQAQPNIYLYILKEELQTYVR